MDFNVKKSFRNARERFDSFTDTVKNAMSGAKDTNLRKLFEFTPPDASAPSVTEMDTRTGSLIRNVTLLSFDTVSYVCLMALEAGARGALALAGRSTEQTPLSVSEQIEAATGMKEHMVNKNLADKLKDAILTSGAVALDVFSEFSNEMHVKNQGHDKFQKRIARELNDIGYDVTTMVKIMAESKPVKAAGQAIKTLVSELKDKGLSFLNGKHGSKTAGMVVLAGVLFSHALGLAQPQLAEAVMAVRDVQLADMLPKSAQAADTELLRAIDQRMPQDCETVLASGLPVRIEPVLKGESKEHQYYVMEARIDTDKILPYGRLKAPEIPVYLQDFLRSEVPLKLNDDGTYSIDITKRYVQDFDAPHDFMQKLSIGISEESFRPEPVFGPGGDVIGLVYDIADKNEPKELTQKIQDGVDAYFGRSVMDVSDTDTVDSRLTYAIETAQDNYDEKLYRRVLDMVSEMPMNELEKNVMSGVFSMSVYTASEMLAHDIRQELARMTEENDKNLGSNMNAIIDMSKNLVSFSGSKEAMAGLAIAAAHSPEEREEVYEILRSKGILPETALLSLRENTVVAKALESAGFDFNEPIPERKVDFSL